MPVYGKGAEVRYLHDPVAEGEATQDADERITERKAEESQAAQEESAVRDAGGRAVVISRADGQLVFADTLTQSTRGDRRRSPAPLPLAPGPVDRRDLEMGSKS